MQRFLNLFRHRRSRRPFGFCIQYGMHSTFGGLLFQKPYFIRMPTSVLLNIGSVKGLDCVAILRSKARHGWSTITLLYNRLSQFCIFLLRFRAFPGLACGGPFRSPADAPGIIYRGRSDTMYLETKFFFTCSTKSLVVAEGAALSTTSMHRYVT